MYTHKRSFEEFGFDIGDVDSDTATSKPAKLAAPLLREAKAALDKLPTEILSYIASHLSTTELLSLRLANRTIEVQLFNDFAAYYFTKKQFMLTEESLQCLVDISLHPTLSTVLEHVVISLDKYRSDGHVRHSPTNDPAVLVARAAAYRQGARDQSVLLASGRDGQLLMRAFQNLPNLRTVGLRDYNSGTRWRDGEGAQWRAYGATTVLEKTGKDLLQVDGMEYAFKQYAGTGSSTNFAARAFITVLQALGEAGARPQNIEILIRNRVNALPDYAFHVPSNLAPLLEPMLAMLRSLLLTVDLQPIYTQGAGGVDVADPDPEGGKFSLDRFLSLTPSLIHLRLNLVSEMPHWHDSGFLDRLATLGPTLLPMLAQLDLGMMPNAHPDSIAAVAKAWSSTLKTLSFWKVTLAEFRGDRAAVKAVSKLNRWPELLERLRKSAPSLESISVGCLAQRSAGRRQRVMLNIETQDGQKPTVNRVYGHEDMQDLKGFRARLEEEMSLETMDGDHIDGNDEEDEGSSSESEEAGGEEDNNNGNEDGN
ncbi:hypothetical protein VTK73DRAFT_303 [Phialemonium thermophilum]|uniref:F-box domain-containing protein n=1 Tax=Phialemonium thermophilum TaxID=223376 RepID=A0ABR3XES9_9PEZI